MAIERELEISAPAGKRQKQQAVVVPSRVTTLQSATSKAAKEADIMDVPTPPDSASEPEELCKNCAEESKRSCKRGTPHGITGCAA